MFDTKRIVFVVYEIPPIGGGVATAAYHLLREFAKNPGLSIDVITSSINNEWETERFSSNILIHKVPIGKKEHRLKKQGIFEVMIRFPFSSGIVLRRILSTQKVDLVHYFGYPGGMLGLLHQRWIPYVVSLRGVDVPGYNHKFGWQYILYKPLARLIWKHSKAIVANSKQLKELALTTLASAQIYVIPNGVDTTLFKPLPETKKFDQFTITAGGTVMGPKKGLEYLLEGFALFHSRYPHTKLLLIGEGVLKPKLKKMVFELNLQRAVEFAGILSHQELAKILPKCHIFCLPSSNEGMSNAMLEAMACGLPIVTTEVGGVHELLRGNGTIIKKNQSESVSIALGELYTNQQLRKKFAKRSFEIASEMSWARAAYAYQSSIYTLQS